MNISRETFVRDVVVAHPASARIFEKLGIDYCCGGGATLSEASEKVRVPVSEVLEQLTKAAAEPTSPEDAAIAAMDVPALLAHIESKHHTFTTTELQRADGLMKKVLAAHGQTHAFLEELSELLEELRQELAVHMQKEERLLFPYLRTLATAVAEGRTVSRPPFHSALNPIGVMHREHDAAGIFLARLREVSSDYTLPEGACGTFRALYESLASLEKDLHQHIHLENNLLFPRAAPLEALALGSGSR